MPAFTDQFLRSLRAPSGGRIEYTDARCAGLNFRVTDKDVRSFSFRFRDPKSGRVLRYTIGGYPELSLAKARKRADELRGRVTDGENPVESRKRDRQTAASRSFEAVAARYLEEHAKRHNSASYARENERNLDNHVLPYWRHRHIDSNKRGDVVELVERLISAGKPVLANRVQALVSTVYSFAIDAGLCEVNPCTRLRKRGAESPATRVLSDHEIRQFWTRALLPPVSRASGLALRLILLTGCRPGEVAGLRRAELENFKSKEKATWLIPGERTKNGRTHAVPLTAMAREVVVAALDLIPPEQDFVFATRSKNGGALRPHSLTVGMKRLKDKITGPAAKTWKSEPPTPHDLRRTVATRLSALGIASTDVSAVLNHVRRDITGRVYDHYDRLAEKRRALTIWAQALKAIVAKEAGRG